MRTPTRQRPHRRLVKRGQAAPHKPAEAVHDSQDEPVPASSAALAEAARAEEAKPSTRGQKAIQAFRISHVKPVGTRKINIMVYGPYGHGKTTFGASAIDVPEMQDVLFIAAEPGDMSLTSRRELDIITINKYDQIARIFDYLTLHCKWRDEGDDEKLLEYEMILKDEIIPLDEQTVTDEWPADPERTWFVEQRVRSGKPMDEPYRYRTVIVDSLSEVHKYLIYKFTGVDIGKTSLSEEVERMEEWQSAQELFRLFIRSFRDLPMNVIYVAAESIEPEKREKVRNPRAGQALPKFAGQTAADIAGFIDIVGYLYREIGKDGEAKRYLYLGAGYEGWISKHRFENLPDLEFIEGIPPLQGPTLSQLIDLARKDAESHATSQARSSTANGSVTAGSHGASPAAPNRSGPTLQGRGRRNTLRRRRTS